MKYGINSLSIIGALRKVKTTPLINVLPSSSSSVVVAAAAESAQTRRIILCGETDNIAPLNCYLGWCIEQMTAYTIDAMMAWGWHIEQKKVYANDLAMLRSHLFS